MIKGWFLEYGLATVFVAAIMPIIPTPMKIFVLSAGAFEVNPIIFIVVFGSARAIRYSLLAWMGLHLGSGTLPYLRQHIWLLIGIAAGLFATIYLLIRLLDRRRKLGRLVEDHHTVS
jgi:membrane protein DedA with SNARE-associated domain